jgi:hypothetical protein
MLSKPLDRIEAGDLHDLADNSVMEGSQLDYKEALPGNDDESKKEFLRDVSAMANAHGGDLVYGIREKRVGGEGSAGIEVVGVPAADIDAKRLWMESLIRDSVKPRLTGVNTQAIPLDSSTVVLIVRVPQSWHGPHVVEFKKHWRFYSRNSAGNYQMDVSQLRDAFLFRDTLSQRLEEFRLDRLAKIVADPSINEGGKIVIHIQPFDSVRPDAQVNILRARANREMLLLNGFDDPTYMESDTRLNFDGLFAYLKRNVGRGYLQIFRSGATEEVDADTFEKTEDGQFVIPSLDFERSVIKGTGRRLALLKDLGVSSPVIIHISLLGVKGYSMQLQDHSGRPMSLSYQKSLAKENPIDRDDLLLRGIVVEDLQGEVLEGVTREESTSIPNYWITTARILRPALDTVWNAVGFKRSLHYTLEGKRSGGIEPDY